MHADTKWVDIPMPNGGVERISRELWNRFEFDRETAYAKGAVYGMDHERAKIVAWLRKFDVFGPLDEYDLHIAADAIERGDHNAV